MSHPTPTPSGSGEPIRQTRLLRTRLFLNLVPFIVILLATGFFAIVLFNRLAQSFDLAVNQRYKSVTVAQDMRTALGRMESAVLMVFDGKALLGKDLFDQNRKRFDSNLRVQIENASLTGEAELNRIAVSNYHAFVEGAERVFNLDQIDAQRATYHEELMPVYFALDKLLDRIRQLNHAAIMGTNESTRTLTHDVTHLMLLGMSLAFISSAFLCYRLSRSILDPIRSLTQASQQLGQGNLDQRVPVLAPDELGQLAGSFNRMADQLRAYRQSTADQILRLHQTLRTTLASFPDPIYVLNAQGQIEFVNPAAEHLSQVLQLDHQPPPALRPLADRALQSGQDFLPDSFKEVIALRLNEDERFYLPRVLSMHRDDQSIAGVALVLYDVTRFRLLDDAKTNLVSTVSHELKTPLTSLRMAIYMLLEGTAGPLSESQRELIATAHEDTERLLRILNDLLDLARLESGHVELRREPVAPQQLVQDAVRVAQDQAVQHKIRIQSNLQKDLPKVSVDRSRISLVLDNFLSNAIKYSPQHSTIVLSATRAEKQAIRFAVKDQGPGIPREFHKRIFDRFFRLAGQTKDGAGLGLSISREIVIAHGGRIGLTSQTGEGSEFYFVLTESQTNVA